MRALLLDILLVPCNMISCISQEYVSAFGKSLKVSVYAMLVCSCECDNFVKHELPIYTGKK